MKESKKTSEKQEEFLNFEETCFKNFEETSKAHYELCEKLKDVFKVDLVVNNDIEPVTIQLEKRKLDWNDFKIVKDFIYTNKEIKIMVLGFEELSKYDPRFKKVCGVGGNRFDGVVWHDDKIVWMPENKDDRILLINKALSIQMDKKEWEAFEEMKVTFDPQEVPESVFKKAQRESDIISGDKFVCLDSSKNIDGIKYHKFMYKHSNKYFVLLKEMKRFQFERNEMISFE